MKPQKSIIKELKTYQQDLYKTGQEGKQFSINDFPNFSRKPIEWTDCEQFIKLRQMQCDKKLAIRLCQQNKIRRSDQQFFDTLHNVNMENVGYKKIQNSTSFLLRQIRQNQFIKQKYRMEFQETQIDNKMSSILDNSFQKFQKSLDKHLEMDKDQSYKFNLKHMTKEELYSKLQQLNIIPKQNLSMDHLPSSNSTHHLNLVIPSGNSLHISQTERKFSKPFVPYSGISKSRGSNFSIKHQFTKLQNNQINNPSLKLIKQNKLGKVLFNPLNNKVKEIKSMHHIGHLNDMPEIQKQHKRHFTNYDITGSIVNLQ